MRIRKAVRGEVLTERVKLPKALPPRARKAYNQFIPKIIWQTAKSNLVPSTIADYCHSWIEKNPEYEYRLFDDRGIYEFIRQEFPNYLRAYNKIKHGAVKADLWRYLIVYKYGGVYADLDSKCVVSLRDWIDPESMWVTHLGINRDVCHWLIISVPENPILKRAAERSYENIVNGRPPYAEFQGFKIDNSRKLQLFQGSPFRAYHAIMTFAGPPILQQASEECFLNGSAQHIFRSTQVVCVSEERQCEMNGNVSHDGEKYEYRKALIDMSAPHYENSEANLSWSRTLYAGMMRRLRRWQNLVKGAAKVR
jgi:Glycosyltransferase sugar-binding region containing DXD motif